MRLIVDTNIIISALIRDSMTRKIITHIDAELLTIKFSEEEIQQYKSVIIKKAGINDIEFEMVLEKLKEKLIFLEDTIVETKMKEAMKIMDGVDPDDTPFIAAALATNSDIWSDDNHFLRQKIIKIWKTNDLIAVI